MQKINSNWGVVMVASHMKKIGYCKEEEYFHKLNRELVEQSGGQREVTHREEEPAQAAGG